MPRTPSAGSFRRSCARGAESSCSPAHRSPSPRPGSRSFLIGSLEELEHEAPPGAVRAVVVTSSKARSRMTPARQALLDRLADQGVVRLVAIADGVHTGGNIGDAQVHEAHALIAVGGGKGVADRAAKMRRKGGLILPLDAQIGALCDDGAGSAGLYQQALSSPDNFAPLAPKALAEALPFLTVHAVSPDLTVQHAIRVLVAERTARDDARSPEVVLLTALPVELEATLRALGIFADPSKTAFGTNVWHTDVPSRSSARSVRVAVACLGAAGNVSAAATAAELAQAYRPRLVVMVGIAAGMRGKCRIGDVVFSERVVAYEPAVLLAEKGLGSRIRTSLGRVLGLGGSVREGRPEMYRLAHAIEQDVVAYLASADAVVARLRSALAAMGVGLTSSADVTGEVRPRMATIASGEKLLRDPAVLAGLRRDTHGKIQIGEMEAAGIAEACRRHGIDFLIVRGISDFGDREKNDDGHRLASSGAAAVAADFVQEGLRLGARIQSYS